MSACDHFLAIGCRGPDSERPCEKCRYDAKQRAIGHAAGIAEERARVVQQIRNQLRARAHLPHDSDVVRVLRTLLEYVECRDATVQMGEHAKEGG